MKNKKIGFVLFVCLLSIGFIMSHGDISKNIEIYDADFTFHLKSSSNSEKIHINNNWSDTKSAGLCTGDGTVSSPYILGNLSIDAGGIGHAINIENTTEYFKIENCTLFNSGGDIHDSGIRLDNVRNGYIVNNTTHDNSRGMSIYSSLNLKIERNRLYDPTGMEIYWTNDTYIYLNTFMTSNIMIFTQWSYMQYYSQVKLSYTFNNNSFTNFLGNYWVEHSGLDENGDGIVDSPYIVYSFVPDNPDLKDFYPLFEPISSYTNIEPAEIVGAIWGFNLITLIGLISIITNLIIITSRKTVKKSKVVSF